MEEIVSTKELIDRLIGIAPLGFEISRRSGMMNSTKAIYYRKELIFYFDMNDDFSFRKSNGVSVDIFVERHVNQLWLIEQTIS